MSLVRILDAAVRRPAPNAVDVGIGPLDLDTSPRTVGPWALVVRHRAEGLPPRALPVDADVRPHPHIGLAAVSCMLEGALTHRDSLGNCCELLGGDLGVTVAGRGVVHSERSERLRVLGGTLDLFQLLLALPDGAEDGEPSFFRVAGDETPTTCAQGATTRWLFAQPPAVTAGLPLTTPVLLAEVRLDAGAGWRVPEVPERAFFVLEGEVAIGDERARAGQVAVLEPGETTLRAIVPSRLLAYGGTSPGPRYFWWNYIHSSLDAIEAAKAAWRAGQVELPPGDTESFTAAPADDGRPLRLLNAR